ncbi:hypothetical protein GS432_03025 [Rhodococcus hoagii]|nr:hypothetical protein [Prescottella equi]
MLTTTVFVGNIDVPAARTIGTALALSAFGLAPFALVMLQMRVFYAGNDMRTPALINIAMVSMKIAVVGASAVTLPSHTVVVMLPVAGSRAYVVGVNVRTPLSAPPLRAARVPCGGRDLRQGAVGVGGSRCLLHRGGRFGTPADRRSP